MKILVIILTFLAAQAYATEQDHTCQGGHNCNTEIPDEPTPQIETVVQTTVEVSPTQTITNEAISGPATATTGGVITTITNKRAYRNTPNLGTAFLSANGCSMPAIFSLVLPGGGVQAGGGRCYNQMLVSTE